MRAALTRSAAEERARAPRRRARRRARGRAPRGRSRGARRAASAAAVRSAPRRPRARAPPPASKAWAPSGTLQPPPSAAEERALGRDRRAPSAAWSSGATAARSGRVVLAALERDRALPGRGHERARVEGLRRPRRRGPAARGPPSPAGSRRSGPRAAGAGACRRCRAGRSSRRSGRSAATSAPPPEAGRPDARARRQLARAAAPTRRARRAGRRARGSRTSASPAGSAVGTSLSECTARSTSRASSASSISFRKAPLPPTASSRRSCSAVAGGGDLPEARPRGPSASSRAWTWSRLPQRERAAARPDPDRGSQVEEAAHEAHLLGLLVARQLLEPHRGRVEQLVDDRGGGRLEGTLLLGGERAQPAGAPWRSRPCGSRRRAGAARRAAARPRASGATRGTRAPRARRSPRRPPPPSCARAGWRPRPSAGRRCRRGTRRPPGRRPRRCRAAPRCRSGTAGRPWRSACATSTSSRWITTPGAPVPLITMSACASSARSDSKGAARPPRLAASCSRLLEGAPAEHRRARAALHHLARRELAHLARARRAAPSGRPARRRSCSRAPPRRGRPTRRSCRSPVSRARALGRGDRPRPQRRSAPRPGCRASSAAS